MNRLTHTLLSGASFVALVFGSGTTPAQAAACATATGPGAYTNAANCDYIIITGDITGDVTNNGDVDGPPFLGPLINTPFGAHTGLFGIVNTNVGVTIAVSISNNGTISIINTGTIGFSDVVVGIGNVGADVDGIVN